MKWGHESISVSSGGGKIGSRRSSSCWVLENIARNSLSGDLTANVVASKLVEFDCGSAWVRVILGRTLRAVSSGDLAPMQHAR
jgi:hypothetical protein